MIQGNSYPKNSKDDEKDDFKEVPISVICHLEQYEFPSPEWVHCLSEEVKSRILFRKRGLTAKVKVATRAQNTLLHMVLILNVWLIS
jgi:hypothetical protein